MSQALHDLGVAQLGAALRNKQVSAVELAEHQLARIAQHAELGAFLATDREVTLAQARKARDDAKATIAQGLDPSTAKRAAKVAARSAAPWRVLMSTRAPRCASAKAVASPIESAPQPVTTQVLPCISA